jgi:hypothetical protein
MVIHIKLFYLLGVSVDMRELHPTCGIGALYLKKLIGYASFVISNQQPIVFDL